MSSNLKTANFDSSVLRYKLVSDSSLTGAAIVDVTQESGTLYYVTLNALTGINNNYYVKFKFTTGEVVVGTTEPDLVLYLAQDTELKLHMPAGVAYTALSVWMVDSADDNGTAQTTSGNSASVTLTMVTS
jgi:hypothetical protein